MSREYLTSNAFLIDKDDVLRRVSFGIRKMPVVLAPGSDALPDELKEYNIKTAQLQGEAILVFNLLLMSPFLSDSAFSI